MPGIPHIIYVLYLRTPPGIPGTMHKLFVCRGIVIC